MFIIKKKIPEDHLSQLYEAILAFEISSVTYSLVQMPQRGSFLRRSTFHFLLRLKLISLGVKPGWLVILV